MTAIDTALYACPACKNDVAYDPAKPCVACASCGRSYPIARGIIDFRYADPQYRTGSTHIDDEFEPPDPNALVEKRGAADVMSRRLVERIRQLRKRHGRVDLIDIGMFMAGGEGLKPFFKEIESDVSCYVGIDPSPYELFKGDGRPSAIKVLRAYGEYLPLRAAQFNLAISIASFDHLFDADRCLEEIKRTLVPDAELYIQLNNDGAWFKRVFPKAADHRREAARRWHNYFWTPMQFRSLLTSHGFEVTTSDGYRYNPVLDNTRLAAALPKDMQARLSRAVDAVGNSLAPDLGGNFAISCRLAS